MSTIKELKDNLLLYLPNLSWESKNLFEANRKIKERIVAEINDLNYSDQIKLSNPFEFIIDKIEKFCYDLEKDVLNNYAIGSPQKAAENLCKLLNLEKKEDCVLDCYILRKDGPLKFRMRKSVEYQVYKKEEMFHISKKRRNIIGNQRYSIPGFPCLYIGSSLYDCWEELRRPDLDRVNYIAINNTVDLSLLDVGFPDEIKGLREFKQVVIFMLSTLIVQNDEYSFKYEYVIPQLLLQSIITHKQYEGIRYLSSRYFKEEYLLCPNEMRVSNSYNIMYNYVIPIQNPNVDYDFCPVLLKKFVLSNPFSPFQYKVRMVSFKNNIARVNDYRDSIFHKYEKAKEIKDLTRLIIER